MPFWVNQFWVFFCAGTRTIRCDFLTFYSLGPLKDSIFILFVVKKCTFLSFVLFLGFNWC